MNRFKLLESPKREYPGDWFCISCEKQVSRRGKNDNQVHIRQSYFISVHPNNARICSKCLGESIREGCTVIDFRKLTDKEYKEVCEE